LGIEHIDWISKAVWVVFLLCLGFGHLHRKDLANDSGWMKIGVVWNELQVQVYV
jgi:hypothetical protein